MQEDIQLAPEPTANPPPEPAPQEPPVGTEGQQEHQEGQEQQSAPPKQVSPDVEARARDMGWRPQTEWRGSPDAWRPADEFLRRGEEVLPIVRSRAQRAEAKVADLEGRIGDITNDFELRLRRLDGVTRVALQNQAQQIGQSYQTLMRQAVEAGDVDKWDKLNRQYATDIGDLQERTIKAYEEPKPAQPAQPAPDPEITRTVQQWIGQQDWWQRDRAMTEAAVNYHGFLTNTKPWLTIDDNLAATERYLATEFPDKFKGRANGAGQQRQQQPAPHAPAVEGGGRQPGSSASRAKGWNELPPEAKKAGEKFISQELYTNDAKGKAEYAGDYWSQE